MPATAGNDKRCKQNQVGDGLARRIDARDNVHRCFFAFTVVEEELFSNIEDVPELFRSHHHGIPRSHGVEDAKEFEMFYKGAAHRPSQTCSRGRYAPRC